jgi:hypothetical protein
MYSLAGFGISIEPFGSLTSELLLIALLKILYVSKISLYDKINCMCCIFVSTHSVGTE